MKEDEPYFVISVVSKMLNIHPQTIRHYERLGFLNPHRTEGNMRLFSRRDVERLERICSYTNMGVNLAGVEIIVRLIEKMEMVKSEMESQINALKVERDRLLTQEDDYRETEDL